MNRLDELLLLWQDRSITADEGAELKQLLATPEARAALAQDLFLTGVLLESLRTQQAAGEVRSDALVERASEHSASGSRLTYYWLTMAISLLFLCVAGYWYFRPVPTPVDTPPSTHAVFAQVEQVEGDFFVINNRQMQPAQTGAVLVPGQGIATAGTDSAAVVQMKDAVRLKLGSDTTVFTTLDADSTGNAGPQLVMEKGDLLIEVTRALRRKKMSVQTPLGLAVAESEETALHISDAAGIVVVRGEVSFMHKATGKAIRLGEGQYLTIGPTGALYASQFFAGHARTWTTFPRIGLDTNTLNYAIAFSPDSKQLAAVNRPGEGAVRLGAIDGKSPPRTLKGDGCVQFSPDGKLLATAEVANILLHDLEAENQVRVLPTRDRRRRIQCLAFAPDGQTLAVGRAAVKNSADVELWDLRTGKLWHTWHAHTASVTCLAFAPDGKLLATGGLDRTVLLWDMESLTERARVAPHPTHPVWSVAFAPQGDVLAIATGPDDFRLRQPGEVALWEIASKQVRLRLQGHSRAVTSVAFAKDGQTLLTGSADTNVRFWDRKTGREYGMLKGHKAAPGFEAVMVALSPDGATLATASFDQTVKLWPTTWMRTPPLASVRLPAHSPSLHDCLFSMRMDAE